MNMDCGCSLEQSRQKMFITSFFFLLKSFNLYNLGKFCIQHGRVFLMSRKLFCLTALPMNH